MTYYREGSRWIGVDSREKEVDVKEGDGREKG